MAVVPSLCSAARTQDRKSIRYCPFALLICIGTSFLMVATALWIYHRAEHVAGTVSSAVISSVNAYQLSVAYSGAAAEGETALPAEMRPERAEVVAAIKALRTDLGRLDAALAPPEAPGVLQIPWSALVSVTGLGVPPDDLTRLWQPQGGTHGRDLVKQQLKVCVSICEAPALTPAERNAYLSRLNNVVVGQVLPRLSAMRTSVQAWEDRTTIWTRIGVLLSFLTVASAVLFTRFAVVGPLLRKLDTANARLAQRNAALEERVVARTADLTRALADVKVAHEMRTRFLASVNHEMRTPMNGVLGVAALMARTDMTEAQRAYLETITQSGKTLVRLIDDVLDVVASTSGHLELRVEPTDLRVLLTDSLDLLRPMAENRGLFLIADAYDCAVPRVMIDPDRFVQVVNNLVGNAIKFTPRGEVRVKLRQLTREGGVTVELVVQDTGPGLPEGDRSRLFEPFERGVGEGAPGTGLGLAVTSALVKQMGGQISAGTAPQGGAEFVVKLPLVAAQDAIDTRSDAA